MTCCELCSAPVFWISSDRKRVPLDAEPIAVVIALSFLPGRADKLVGYSRAGDQLAGVRPGPDEIANGTLHLNHMRRCPGARRGNRG